MTQSDQALERLEFSASPVYRTAQAKLRALGWEASEARQALLELHSSRLEAANDSAATKAAQPVDFDAEILRGVDRLLAGEPLQYITGRALFDGHWLKSDARALIPRPETEELAAYASADVPENARILDAMTGSGCLAIALAHRHPDAEISAFDLSEEALGLARENAEQFDKEISLHLVDALLEPWHRLGPFDLIVSNPPYIPVHERTKVDRNVLENEPSMALFAPEHNELAFVEAIRDQSLLGALKIGGKLWIELHPPLSQPCLALFERGWEAEIVCDLSQKQRFIKALRTA